jgi:hypothetical protein
MRERGGRPVAIPVAIADKSHKSRGVLRHDNGLRIRHPGPMALSVRARRARAAPMQPLADLFARMVAATCQNSTPTPGFRALDPAVPPVSVLYDLRPILFLNRTGTLMGAVASSGVQR